MVVFLIASTAPFNHLAKRNKKLPQESDIVKFYLRLYQAYKGIIDSRTFSPNSNLDQALKTRLIQFSTNFNFTSVRPYLSACSDVLHLTDAKLKKKIVVRSLILKIGPNLSRTSAIKRIATEYVKFWILWLATLLSLVMFWRANKISPNAPGSIVYGCLGDFNNSPKSSKRMKQYFDESSQSGISDSVFFVFKGQKLYQKLGKNLRASRFPEALFVYNSALLASEAMCLFWIHISSVWTSHACLFKNTSVLSIFSELANFGVMGRLEKLGHFKATLFSTSSIPSHNLTSNLSQDSIKHHVYYSCIPTNPVQKNDADPEVATLNTFLLIPISGTHWVWSDEDKRVLSEKYKQEDVRTGGVPSLFFSRPRESSSSQSPVYDIVIFDVTPINIEKFNPYNMTYYYGRYETAITLIENSLWAANTLSNGQNARKLKIALKPKRKNLRIHDMRYWQDLNALEKTHSNFIILDPETDLGELFHPKTVFISRPFTSAAHLAAINGSHSIYHDPNGEITDTSVKFSNLMFSAGKENLAETLQKLICNDNNK